MLEWAKKQLETVLGKTVVGLIGVFALGAITAWSLPRWLVTTEVFAQEVQRINSDIEKRDAWQDLKVIELRKDIWTRQRYELEDKIDTQGLPPTTRQQNRMEEIKKELGNLEQEEGKARAIVSP